MRLRSLALAILLLLVGCGLADTPERREEGNAGLEKTTAGAEKPGAEGRVAREAPEAEETERDGETGSRRTRDPKKEGGPAPGYNLVETPDGGLSAEVPPSWGVETGEDSEKGADAGSWSYHAGEYLTSSITTAKSLEGWYGGSGSSGAYFVASKALAEYSDEEIARSLLNATKGDVCAEEGPYTDYERGPYTGKLQTWYGCGDDDATSYTLAAAPEGRECVVALNARVSEEADREDVEHLVDSFEVDCGTVTAGPLPEAADPPVASAAEEPDAPDGSSSASAGSSASASSSSSASSVPAPPVSDDPWCPEGSVQNAVGTTCTNLETGEIVKEVPPPPGVSVENPCPEGYALDEQGLCERWLFPTASASPSAINNDPEECEYVGVTGAVHDPNGTCTPAKIEAVNE